MKKLFLIMIFLSVMGCDSVPEVPEATKEIVVDISSPRCCDLHFYEEDLPLLLKGTALAFNEDFSEKISWSSNVDGHLGIGKEISVNLSLGPHSIEAFADNGVESGSYSIDLVINSDIKKSAVKEEDKIIKVVDPDGDVLIVNRTKQVITDTSTGLMWQRIPDTYTFTYQKARRYAQNSKLGGYSDWRLPTKTELMDICNLYYDKRNAILHDEFNTFVGGFWTSTTISNLFEEFFMKDPREFKYAIHQKDIKHGTFFRLISQKSYAYIGSQLHVRLVRKAQ